ncbi:XP_042229523.1uncharacterized protein LOC121871369 [Octopus vulgaris]|uniref:XP_042229523.1uncharacterized protein LOC121871369 n=1 Tax=Octopus vulgaris TaxID=6645 RepID=A0AA36BRK5_OCTVU|nr:XP_042229523.1uncharacterized protein LOC121871369 [Octopus vulgaris]
MQFCTEVELLPDIPEATADPDMQGYEDADLDVDLEARDADEVEYISVVAILDESNSLDLNLPVHMKCAAHTVNLVASMDADNALDSTSYKSAYGKNLLSRSTVMADSILDALKRRLVVPNSTRWNSTYDSVVEVNNLLEKNRGAVHRVMRQQKLQTFTDSDVGFLTEYAQVMSNVAKALDKIQCEDQAYLESLLPTVVATVMKLKEAKFKHLPYCSPLVRATLADHEKVWAPPKNPGLPAGRFLQSQVSPVLAGAVY